MRAVVFAGPTVAEDDIRAVLDAEVRPPVAQGDVYRAAREGPLAIGIIDGYFDGVPSVWHKEILWAMEQGIAVFGSASMGALRAAELADFGMIGVGSIFEAYHSNEISDDDEVAVLHGPAELGFVPLSEPMVSVRATVARAQAENIVVPEVADVMVTTAKSIHYRDRTWIEILDRLEGAAGVASFSEWLPEGKVDAKRDDALAMLHRMATEQTEGAARDTQGAHRVERTLVWNSLVRRIETETEGRRATDDGVLDELRLDPVRYADVRARAALRSLAQEDAARRGVRPERDALQSLMDRHRRQKGLPRRDALMRWLGENDLDVQGYEALLTETATVEAVIAARSEQLDAHILAELRWSGDFAEVKARADDKAAAFEAAALAPASADRLRMMIWFFETRLGREVPDDLDAYAASIGLTGRDALVQLIEREFMYCCYHLDAGGMAKAE